MVHVVMHRKGQAGVAAVNGTGGGVNKVGDAVMSASFQDVQKPEQVAVQIGVGIGQGVADAGLGGKVHHHRGFLPGEEVGQVLPVGDVEAEKAERPVLFQKA